LPLRKKKGGGRARLLEGWKAGRLEGWKAGRLEGWAACRFGDGDQRQEIRCCEEKTRQSGPK